MTTVTPQVTVMNKNAYFDGTIIGGLTAETYVNNPGLNYVGFNANMVLALDRTIQQLAKRATLSITEAFRFTPQLPAFAAPTDAQNAIDPAIVRGFQAARANSYTITHGANVGYNFTPSTKWLNTYSHSTLRFGTAFAQPGSGGAFFSTTYQTVTSSLTHKITALDTLGFTYNYALANYGSGNTGINQYETHTGRGTVTHAFNPYWTIAVGGGAVYLPAQAPGTTSIVTHVEDATLSYRDQLTAGSLGYSRSVIPSFGVGSAPMVNENLYASLSQGFGPKWTAMVSGYYGTAQSNPRGLLSYTSISGTASLSYAIRRDTAMNLIASLSYSRQEFDQSFNNVGFSFNRDLAMFNLSAAWY